MTGIRHRSASDGTVIAYRRAGSGPGTVLVHGGFIDSRSWEGLIGALSPTRTVVAPDRRGHGDSGPFGTGYRLCDDELYRRLDAAADRGDRETLLRPVRQ